MGSWTRRHGAVLVLLLVVAGCGAGGDSASKPSDEAFPIEAGKALVSEAAAMSLKDWKGIATAPKPPAMSDFADQPFTVLFLSLPVTIMNTPGMNEELRLPDTPAANAFSKAIYPGVGVKNAKRPSAIHPEYITSLKAEVSGDRVDGVVKFSAPGAYRGKVHFSGRKVDGTWQVTEFRLPDFEKKTTRNANGRWKIAEIDSKKKTSGGVDKATIRRE